MGSKSPSFLSKVIDSLAISRASKRCGTVLAARGSAGALLGVAARHQAQTAAQLHSVFLRLLANIPPLP